MACFRNVRFYSPLRSLTQSLFQNFLKFARVPDESYLAMLTSSARYMRHFMYIRYFVRVCPLVSRVCQFKVCLYLTEPGLFPCLSILDTLVIHSLQGKRLSNWYM